MSPLQLKFVVVLCVITVTSGKPTEHVFESAGFHSSKLENEQVYESTSLCTSKKHIINPDDLMSFDDKYDFDQNFQQSIEVELCENEGAPCSDYPLLKTKCKQKYLSIQLQVVSKNSTGSEVKTFSIPSNCECAYYKFRL